jgi:carboxymethylenebutenolidase
MELRTEWVEFRVGGRPMPGYLARPARVEGALPGVVVIQEVWGVDEHIQDLVRRFATAGYTAFAPDLYALGGSRPEALAAARIEALQAWLNEQPPSVWTDPAQREAALAALPEARRAEIASTMETLFGGVLRDLAGYTESLAAAVAFLQEHPFCRGRAVGCTGYCMGGALSARLAAAAPGLRAAVVYYGAPPDEETVARIGCPVRGFYGGEDRRITDQVPAFAAAMARAQKDFAYRVYPGAPHAFFNDRRPSYHVEAARDAWARTLAFFAETLAG